MRENASTRARAAIIRLKYSLSQQAARRLELPKARQLEQLAALLPESTRWATVPRPAVVPQLRIGEGSSKPQPYPARLHGECQETSLCSARAHSFP